MRSAGWDVRSASDPQKGKRWRWDGFRCGGRLRRLRSGVTSPIRCTSCGGRTASERTPLTYAWGTITAAIALAAIVITALVTLHANDSRFRWWWPTNWMAIPAAMLVIGLIVLVLPIRKSPVDKEASSATAVGLATVTERILYERMVRDMLSEAVRELSRYEGAEQLGGLNLVLEYRTAFDTKVDAAVVSGRGEYVAIQVKHSFAKVPLMEMSYAVHQAAGLPSKPKAFKLLFISNQEPGSEVDVSYLDHAFGPGTFSYVRVTGPEDLPNVVEAIRAAFQIHG
jgi:hypothetical protein